VRFLTLDRTAVTDEGIKHLRGMNLQSLDLSSTRITDAGLTELGQFDFPRLKTIALENTKVTNTGLLKLANFKALEWVSVTGTKVTRDGIRHFKAKLPEATVLD
jgi:internalin A